MLFVSKKFLSGKDLFALSAGDLDKFMNMKRERICKKDPGYQSFKEQIEQQIKEEQYFYDGILKELREK